MKRPVSMCIALTLACVFLAACPSSAEMSGESCEAYVSRVGRQTAVPANKNTILRAEGAARTSKGKLFHNNGFPLLFSRWQSSAPPLLAKLRAQRQQGGPQAIGAVVHVYAPATATMGDLATKLAPFAELGAELALVVNTTSLPPIPNNIPAWAAKAIKAYRDDPVMGLSTLAEQGVKRALAGCTVQGQSAYDRLGDRLDTAEPGTRRYTVHVSLFGTDGVSGDLSKCGCRVGDRQALEALLFQWLRDDWQPERWVPLPLGASKRTGKVLVVSPRETVQGYVTKLEALSDHELDSFRLQVGGA